MWPKYEGFFRVREQKSASRPANGLEITPDMVA